MCVFWRCGVASGGVAELSTTIRATSLNALRRACTSSSLWQREWAAGPSSQCSGSLGTPGREVVQIAGLST
ncbi:hypothetical protein E2C01_086090 [Portunus trituberculatus]|uniref:Uncharacterized protein n=1 Tax=Portunus trituberculatus TaxID=210409 RepID=A0A5B7JCI2_PORTR|nr:hypothetical protein [Portunus trituberculatus]